jgi:hypothetical protein
MWYILDAMLSGGRTAIGRSLSTMEGHRAAYAYYFRMYSKDDAPTSCTEFTDGMKGIGNRVKYNTAQAHAFSVAFILEVQRRQADLIIVDPASIQFGDPAFGPAYEALLFLCVFLVSFMCCLRGNEAYLLELAQVQNDAVLGNAARQRQCSEHYLFNFLGTKTAQAKKLCVPCVAQSRAGLRLKVALGAFIILRCRLPAPLASTKLFVRLNGAKMLSHYFLHSFLRPMFLQIKSSTQFSAAFAKVELHMVVTNSLRRAGNTAAAAAGIPKYLRNGHCRWRQVHERGKASLDMDDLYDEVGVEDKLSVSYYMQDEIRLALRDLQTPSARIAQRRLKF